MIKIPEKISYVLNTLSQNGFKAYIVGGCVRDSLCSKIPNDYDITTNALPEDIIKLFDKTLPTGIKHGTVTVIIENEPIEVTTFRTESGYTDSRHPESVEFVDSVKEDLSRRDFTVNAIAYNQTEGIVDYFGGAEDIKRKILRSVGNPEKRFSEDALRILRLFRFASCLGFEMEENTLKWAKKLSPLLEKISKERIFTEIKKAVCGKNPYALKELINCRGLFFLGITECPDFSIVYNCRKNENLALFVFLYLSDANVNNTLSLLKATNKLKDYCSTMQKLLKSDFPKTKADIKEMVNISNIEIFRDYLYFKCLSGKQTEDTEQQLDEILKNNEPYSISHLAVSGNDLLKLGYKGEEIGEKLELLRKAVCQNSQLNSKQKLINKIKA